MNNKTQFINTLLEYHAQNLPLTPLKDKVPTTKKWQQTKVENFNLDDFKNCTSAGVVLPKGWVIIDVDNHNNDEGTKSLKRLSKDLDFDLLLNAGKVVKTANNGLHLYYKIPEEFSDKLVNELKAYKSVEFKGLGRQVVICNSALSNGKYYSNNILYSSDWNKICELPKHLVAMITNKSDNNQIISNKIATNLDHPSDVKAFKSYIENQDDVGKGGRNNAVFKFAAEGKNRALSQKTILQCIVDSGKLIPLLGKDELRRTIKSAFDNEEVEIGSKSVVEDFGSDFLFDDKFVPESVRNFVNDGAHRLQCPKDFIFAGLVVTLSSLAATNFKIQVTQFDDEQFIIPNLWGMIIGDPSLRKTTALKKSVNLLKPLEIEAYKAHEQEMDIYNSQVESLKEKKSKISPPKPTLKRYILNDSTIEKIGVICAESPGCKLILRDELIGYLEGLEKDKNKQDKPFFIEGWDGDGTYRVDRISRDSLTIHNLGISIIGTIQPKTLSNYFSKFFEGVSNDGFVQRFQVSVYPDTSNREFKIVDQAPDRSEIKKLEEIAQKISTASFIENLDIPRDSSGRHIFTFSEEAQKIYNKWFENLMNVEIPQEDEETLKQHLAKYSKLVPSLAIIFHLVDVAANEKLEKFISVNSLEMAISYSRYLKAHAKKIYSYCKKRKSSDSAGIVFPLLNKIKDGSLGQKFFVRDIIRKDWSGLKDYQTVITALEALENEKYITSEKTIKSICYKPNFILEKSSIDNTDRTDSHFSVGSVC